MHKINIFLNKRSGVCIKTFSSGSHGTSGEFMINAFIELPASPGFF